MLNVTTGTTTTSTTPATTLPEKTMYPPFGKLGPHNHHMPHLPNPHYHALPPLPTITEPPYMTTLSATYPSFTRPTAGAKTPRSIKQAPSNSNSHEMLPRIPLDSLGMGTAGLPPPISPDLDTLFYEDAHKHHFMHKKHQHDKGKEKHMTLAGMINIALFN